MSDEGSRESALAAVTADGRSVRSHLDGDEPVEFDLSGTVLDTVRGTEEASRSRTMAAEPGGVTMLLTDGQLLFVVERRDHADVTALDRSNVAAAGVETMGEAVRLAVETREGPDYTFYPDDADESDVRRVADELSDVDANDGDGRPAVDDADANAETDPLDRLERLADLHERGALTDEEFESKKRDLLERI